MLGINFNYAVLFCKLFACLVSLNSSLFDLFSVFSIILCSVYLNFYCICFLLYNYNYLFPLWMNGCTFVFFTFVYALFVSLK